MRTRRRPDHLFALRDQYVRAAGEVASVIVETDADIRKVDHVWVQIRAGEFGRLQISLSTYSRQSRAAGFDPRVRVGIITSRWSELPSPEVRVTTPLDYARLEAAQRVDYVSYE